MDGIERIIARIEEEAAEERSYIAEDASLQIGAIKARYKDLADKEYGDALLSGTKEEEARFERLKSASQMRSRKAALEERQAIVGEAYIRAAELIRALPDDEYAAVLAKLAAAAVTTGSETLIFAPGDLERAGEKTAKLANAILSGRGITAGLTVSSETRDIAGGVIVSGGDIEVNCALDAIASSLRRETEAQVVAALGL